MAGPSITIAWFALWNVRPTTIRISVKPHNAEPHPVKSLPPAFDYRDTAASAPSLLTSDSITPIPFGRLGISSCREGEQTVVFPQGTNREQPHATARCR